MAKWGRSNIHDTEDFFSCIKQLSNAEKQKKMKNQKVDQKLSFILGYFSTLGTGLDFTLWYSVSSKETSIYDFKIISNSSSGSFLCYSKCMVFASLNLSGFMSCLWDYCTSARMKNLLLSVSLSPSKYLLSDQTCLNLLFDKLNKLNSLRLSL